MGVWDARRVNAVLTGLLVGAVVIAIGLLAVFAGRWLRRRMLDPPGVRAAGQALRTAGLAAPPLREGLTAFAGIWWDLGEAGTPPRG